jgi:hypothetical protein
VWKLEARNLRPQGTLRHGQTVTMPVVRQFSHWPCRTLSWTRSLVGVQYDLPGSLGSTRSGHRATAADAAPQAVVVMDFCLFLSCECSAHPPSGDTAGAVFFHWLCCTAVSADPYLQTSLSQKSRQDGAGGRGREATARRADAAFSMTRSQDRRTARLIGRSVQEVARKVARMPTFRANTTSGQPATRKTRRAINVTMTITPPARKLGSRGRRMSGRLLHLRVLRGMKRTQAGGRAEPFFSLALS